MMDGQRPHVISVGAKELRRSSLLRAFTHARVPVLKRTSTHRLATFQHRGPEDHENGIIRTENALARELAISTTTRADD